MKFLNKYQTFKATINEKIGLPRLIANIIIKLVGCIVLISIGISYGEIIGLLFVLVMITYFGYTIYSDIKYLLKHIKSRN